MVHLSDYIAEKQQIYTYSELIHFLDIVPQKNNFFENSTLDPSEAKIKVKKKRRKHSSKRRNGESRNPVSIVSKTDINNNCVADYKAQASIDTENTKIEDLFTKAHTRDKSQIYHNRGEHMHQDSISISSSKRKSRKVRKSM